MVQYPYPEVGWSTGKIRKKGDQYAKMDRLQRGLPGEGGQLAEMDRAAGMGVAARGGPTGTMQMPGTVPTQKIVSDAIQGQKAEIEEAYGSVAKGDMTSTLFKKMLQKFGWTQSSEPGKFRDPDGNDHIIGAEADATSTKGNGGGIGRQ